jgi:TRAP-type transport system small permease protein
MPTTSADSPAAPSPTAGALATIERLIVRLCEVVLWVSMTVIFVILSVNTVLRYGGGKSLQWANEVPELLFPWLVMAGVVMAAVRGSHITTSFLVEAVPAKYHRAFHLSGALAVAGLYGTLFVATWRMLPIVHDEKSPILGVPGSVTYGCVMVGLGLLSMLALFSAWRGLSGAAALPTSDHSPHW